MASDISTGHARLRIKRKWQGINWLVWAFAGIMMTGACVGLQEPTPMQVEMPTPDPPNTVTTQTGSPDYLAGMELFNDNCLLCHGEKATGSDAGPPLIHAYYQPYHHPDFAFHSAVNRGVPMHHWFFGDMPPVPGLSEQDVDQIICYVRTLQKNSGMPVSVSC